MGTTVDLAPLYRGREGRVDFLDVPPMTYAVLAGAGDPERPPFLHAVRVVSAVAAAARAVAKRRCGIVPPAMPLETVWWLERPLSVDIVAALALGVADVVDLDRGALRWKVMIAQPGLDEIGFEQALQHVRGVARSGVGLPRLEAARLDEVHFERWEEGRVAQALHVGPCSQRSAVLGALHEAIGSAGYRARGRQHEIHLNDVRRTPPAEQRTLIRQPVDTA